MNQPANDMTWKSLGECLTKSRHKQKLELHEVAATLRLPVRTVQAIEQGNIDRLPSIYMKGHIQRYIHLLNASDHNLDGITAASLFQRDEQAAGQASSQYPRPLPVALMAAPSRRWFDHTLRVASYLVVTAGVVIPLVWWFTQGAVRMSFDESLVSSSVPGIDSDPLPADAGATQSIRPGHLSASAAPFASMRPRPGPAAADGLILGHQVLLADALGTALPATDVPVPPYRSMPDTAAFVGRDNNARSGNHAVMSEQLELRLLNDSWVEITATDGTRIEFDLLKTGQLYEYQVNLPLDILIGKASAVDVKLNGMPVDLSPHTRGNVAKLKLHDLSAE